MYQVFNFYNQADVPSFTLTNPNKNELYSLDLGYDRKLTLRYNGLSELSFKFPKYIQGEENLIDSENEENEPFGEEETEAYDFIKNKRLVKIENIGYFTIMNAVEDLDGGVFVKTVSCESLETELKAKKLTAFGGTFKLYDPFNPEGTLLDRIVSLAPNWSVGTIDPDLLLVYRTFNVSDTNIYNFLMTDCEKAYGCIFTFNTFNRTISAVSYNNATTSTDIFLSFNNLVKKATFKEMSEEIATALYVYGGNNLDIRSVNPLGGTIIYNFDYYKNTDWMTQSLIDAVTAWESAVATAQPVYADTLTTLKGFNATLIIQQGELTELNNEYLSLQGVQKVRIQEGLPYTDINALLEAKQLEIDSKNSEITSTQLTIESIKSQLQTIVTSLSFPNNFTNAQFQELTTFMFENTYQNDNIIITDSMTPVQIQEQSQQLYDQAQQVIARVAYPRYEFSSDLVNFLQLKEFEVFINQLELGCTVTVDIDELFNIEAVLLELSINYDKPNNFTLTLSNRFRLDNGGYIFTDLYGQVVKTGSSVSFNDLKWSDWTSNYKNDVTTFITSALDATVNNIVNASNQEILINQNGLRGRTYDSNTNSYNPTQVWLTSSVLAFTDDAFQTAKLALGEITINGQTTFGLVADSIVGRLIAGNQLTIANDTNSFVLDTNGATLTNATFSIVSTNGKSKIFLDPANGIKIQSNLAGTWRDTFFVDSSGNLNFTGNLSGASGTFSGSINANSGTIGGWTISDVGISDAFGNYIKSNGQIKLGNLLISGSSATFTGTIYADKLVGQITQPQIANEAVGTNQIGYGNLDAGVMGSGSMSGDFISGGTMSGPGGSNISMSQSGQITLRSGYVQILAGVSSIQVTGSSVGLFGSGAGLSVSDSVHLDGGITANGRVGFTGTFTVSGHLFRFQDGILY